MMYSYLARLYDASESSAFLALHTLDTPSCFSSSYITRIWSSNRYISKIAEFLFPWQGHEELGKNRKISQRRSFIERAF